ncbi:MAG: hypothetical protein ABSG43_00420 [Solirubrobacteraceae bacterium]|jgi:hypothetical protein
MSDRECLLAGVAIGLAAEVWLQLRDARFAGSMALHYRRAAQLARASEQQYYGWLEECYGWLEERDDWLAESHEREDHYRGLLDEARSPGHRMTANPIGGSR